MTLDPSAPDRGRGILQPTALRAGDLKEEWECHGKPAGSQLEAM